MAQQAEHRRFGAADEVREFPNGRAEILKIGGADIGRLVFRPGWRWSNDVKPIAGTESCTRPAFPVPRVGPAGASAWTTGPSSWPGPVMSPPCPVATTPGWSARNRSSWWTGSGPAITPASDRCPRLEVVEAFGQAWAAHDLDAAMAFLSDDCLFDSTGPAPDGSRHVGPDQVRRAWKPYSRIRRPVSRPRRPSALATAWSSAGATTGTAAMSAAWTCSRCETADHRETVLRQGVTEAR